MRSPGRAPPRHIPMVPAGPHGLPRDREGGFIPTRPAKHHGATEKKRFVGTDMMCGHCWLGARAKTWPLYNANPKTNLENL